MEMSDGLLNRDWTFEMHSLEVISAEGVFLQNQMSENQPTSELPIAGKGEGGSLPERPDSRGIFTTLRRNRIEGCEQSLQLYIHARPWQRYS